MRTSPFKTKTITRKSRRHNVRNGVGSTSELVTVAEPVIPRGPWLVGIPLYLLGLFLGRVWLPGDTEQAVFSLVFLCAGAVIGGFSWAYAKARTRFQRWHATATPPLFVLILVVPLCSGWGRYSALVMLTYWVVLSGGWVARVARSVWGDGADMHTQESGGAIASSLGLDGVVVSKVERAGKPGQRPVRITSRWTMPAPRGYADVVAGREAIVNTSRAVTAIIRRVPTDPRGADVTVVLKDQLVKPVRYPGPGDARSIMDPMHVGVRQDGTPELMWLITPLGAVRLLVAGCSGSGKSGLLWALLCRTALCSDVVWWVIDTVKDGQTVGPGAEMIERIARTPEQAGQLLGDVEREVTERSAALGDDKAWHPGCGFPAIIVWVEEAAGLTSSPLGKRFTRLSERCRSVGIILVLSMQRPSGKNMPTDARAQFTSSACFGLDDAEAPKMVLSPMTIKGGANPEDLADTAAGMHWIETPGVPRQDWAEPCRTFLVEPADVRLAAENAVERPRVYQEKQEDGSSSSVASSAVSKEEAVGMLVEEFGSGVWLTKSLTPRWKELTGAHRATMHRYLEAHPGVVKNDDGTWRFANGSVRPGA